MYEALAVRWARKQLKVRPLPRCGAPVALHLHQHEVGRAHPDQIPGAQAASGTGDRVSRSFQQPPALVLVAGALPLGRTH